MPSKTEPVALHSFGPCGTVASILLASDSALCIAHLLKTHLCILTLQSRFNLCFVLCQGSSLPCLYVLSVSLQTRIILCSETMCVLCLCTWHIKISPCRWHEVTHPCNAHILRRWRQEDVNLWPAEGSKQNSVSKHNKCKRNETNVHPLILFCSASCPVSVLLWAAAHGCTLFQHFCPHTFNSHCSKCLY